MDAFPECGLGVMDCGSRESGEVETAFASARVVAVQAVRCDEVGNGSRLRADKCSGDKEGRERGGNEAWTEHSGALSGDRVEC